LLSFLFLVTTCTFGAQRDFDASLIDKERLTRSLEKLAREYKIPDYSMALVYKDSLYFTLNKNKDNAGKNYLIGSCSKSFTALAVMRLVNEGMIDLDKPVKQYLPWFQMKNPDYTSLVTVRHLLNHKSGFERQYGFFDVKTQKISDYEMSFAAHLKNIDVQSAPGSAFLYSNLNYVMLGLIVWHVSGQSYSDYLLLNFKSEIGLQNTFFKYLENRAHNLVESYLYSIFFRPSRSRDYFYSDFLIPAGYISSNITDISNYLRFMLNRTVTSTGDTILSAESYNLLTGKGHNGYAMGWFRFETDSVEIITHTGLDENFASSFALYPELGLGSAILCNINSLEFCSKVDQEIQNMILGKPTSASSVSFEKIMRWGTSLLPLLILAGLIYNLTRLRKYGACITFIREVMPNLRLLAGLILSLVLIFGITSAYQMFITNSIRFQPDIGWGIVMVAVFGLMSSIARYLGTSAKIHF
ncbi:MAG: class A beta-lactamase-related serine hydrolase, partial [Alphaproteobacteria bacterium]